MKSFFLVGLACFVGVLFQCRDAVPKTIHVTSSKKNAKLQYSFHPVSYYLYNDLIHLEYNKINYYGNVSSLKGFYQKLQKLDRGEDVPINIVHFGGSHVQAGQLTSALRQRFDHFSENSHGARGFVFPSRLVKSNGPDFTKINFSGEWKSCKCANNNHHCDWGVAGQSAITNSKKSILKTWAFDMDSLIYRFQSVRLYRIDKQNAFDVVIKNENVVINATQSYIDITFDTLQDTLEIEIRKQVSGDSSFELQGFLFGNDQKKGVSYHDLGVNGAGIKSYLRCESLEKQLADLNPDLIIIGLGLNDTYVPEDKFQPKVLLNQYQEFIDRIKQVNPAVNFLLMTNNDHFYHHRFPNRNSLIFNSLIDTLVHRNHFASWDLFSIMGGEGSIAKWEKQGLAKPDLIHFTNKGYHLQASLLFDAILDDFHTFQK